MPLYNNDDPYNVRGGSAANRVAAKKRRKTKAEQDALRPGPPQQGPLRPDPVAPAPTAESVRQDSPALRGRAPPRTQASLIKEYNDLEQELTNSNRTAETVKYATARRSTLSNDLIKRDNQGYVEGPIRGAASDFTKAPQVASLDDRYAAQGITPPGAAEKPSISGFIDDVAENPRQL
jgi:hypothetical protein